MSSLLTVVIWYLYGGHRWDTRILRRRYHPPSGSSVLRLAHVSKVYSLGLLPRSIVRRSCGLYTHLCESRLRSWGGSWVEIRTSGASIVVCSVSTRHGRLGTGFMPSARLLLSYNNKGRGFRLTKHWVTIYCSSVAGVVGTLGPLTLRVGPDGPNDALESDEPGYSGTKGQPICRSYVWRYVECLNSTSTLLYGTPTK